MYEYRCKIDRVVDGDTVDVDIDLGFDVVLKSQRVRLFGIDTPESRTSDDEEKVYGKLATEYVVNFLEGQDVVLKTREYDSKGKFGRILGELWVGDSNLNQCLVDNHHAVRYYGQSKEEIKEAHLENRKYLDTKG